MNMTLRYTDRDGNDVEFTAPAKFEVCDRCYGHGTHVNPGVDGHGLSAEDFDADPDFAEAYFSGRYDVRCAECKGERVVLAVDEDRIDTWPADIRDDYEAWHAEQRQNAEWASIEAAERRMGA